MTFAVAFSYMQMILFPRAPDPSPDNPFLPSRNPLLF